MEALIRSATLADTRTRLGQRSPFAEQTASPQDDTNTVRSRLREEVEQEVRAEFAAGLEEMRARERQCARSEGYAVGLREGRDIAQAELDEAKAAIRADLDAAVRLVHQVNTAAIAKFDAAVGAVAFAALRRMVGKLAATELFAHSVVEQVCTSLRTETVATARVHPRDVQTLNAVLERGRLNLGSLTLDIVADESLELGGCIVESRVGTYDGSLESQLRRLYAALTQASLERDDQ